MATYAKQVDEEAFARVNIVDVLDGDGGGGAKRDDAVGFEPSH